jgi:hypothetical protein
MFDAAQKQLYFPQRIIEVPPPEGSAHLITHYQLSGKYIKHLLCTMELTTTVLNKFLQATDSAKSFSFGSSAQFGNRTFADIVRSNWATRQVVLSLEKCILRQLETARKAISSFILSMYAESPTRWYS